jgi:hypothetical protein
VPAFTLSALEKSLSLNMLIMTSFLDKTDKVSGDTNFVADGVIITRTSAPALINNLTRLHILYAAIPPDIPTNIFLPLSIVRKVFLIGIAISEI